MKTGTTARDGYDLSWEVSGNGPPVVFLHALGLNRQIWDDVAYHLPDHTCWRLDMRGHGRSGVPDGPYTMGGLVSDVEAVMDAEGIKDAVVVGLSVGGMIAQGLAVKRLDLVRGLVLSNTAAKFGQPGPWADRAAAVRDGGIAAIHDTMLERWFGPSGKNRGTGSAAAGEASRHLMQCAPEGYAAVCEAIAGTDFYTPTSGLRLPTLGIAGDRDSSTPPDLVRETVDLIPGSDFLLLRGSGHLPCLDAPGNFAKALITFFEKTGHV